MGLPIAASLVRPDEWLLGILDLIPIAGGGVAWWRLRRDELRQALVSLLVTTVVLAMASFGWAAGRGDRHQNAPYLVAALRAEEPGEVQLAAYRFFRESMVCYSGQQVRHCDTMDELRSFVAGSPHPCVFTADACLAQVEQTSNPASR